MKYFESSDKSKLEYLPKYGKGLQINMCINNTDPEWIFQVSKIGLWMPNWMPKWLNNIMQIL